jgi:hypothetical protein
VEPALVAGLVAGGTSVVVTAITLYGGQRTNAVQRRQAAEAQLASYREPLVDAAFDLQSRLYNILHDDFLDYADDASPRRDLALKTTAFRVAQYFGWAELLRERVQVLKLDTSETTTEVFRLMAQARQLFNTDSLDDGAFMLWRDEQRGLGELMIDRKADPPRCFGFAHFDEAYDETFGDWCGPFVRDLVDGRAQGSKRLQLLQRTVCELVKELDDRTRPRYSDDLHMATRPMSAEAADERLREVLKPRAVRNAAG